MKAVRKFAAFTFVEINDGSVFDSLQIMVDSSHPHPMLQHVAVGASVAVRGHVRLLEGGSGKQKHSLEVVVTSYPIEAYNVSGNSVQSDEEGGGGAPKKEEGGGKDGEAEWSGLRVVGEAGEEYPLQKKRHSMEYLRQIAHLRPRTNTFGAVARIRNAAEMALHR